jgi:protein-disulfide isomerase-like protein with CxxC motif
MLQIACLCAAWCRACEAYAPLFAELTEGQAARWIDIEDESALLGDYEVEAFPTLLLFDAERLHFAGAVRPDAATLQRLIAAAGQAGALGLPPPSVGLQALLQRLRDDAATLR